MILYRNSSHWCGINIILHNTGHEGAAGAALFGGSKGKAIEMDFSDHEFTEIRPVVSGSDLSRCAVLLWFLSGWYYVLRF